MRDTQSLNGFAYCLRIYHGAESLMVKSCIFKAAKKMDPDVAGIARVEEESLLFRQLRKHCAQILKSSSAGQEALASVQGRSIFDAMITTACYF